MGTKMKLYKIFNDLFGESSDFHADAYGHLTNQLGHAWLGNVLTSWSIWMINCFSGSYPSQSLVAIFCTIVYFIWWELGWQGWKGWDTIDDTMFFGIGTTLFFFLDMSEEIRLASKYEFFADWTTIDILSTFHLFGFIFLMPGVVRRIRQVKS